MTGFVTFLSSTALFYYSLRRPMLVGTSPRYSRRNAVQLTAQPLFECNSAIFALQFVLAEVRRNVVNHCFKLRCDVFMFEVPECLPWAVVLGVLSTTLFNSVVDSVRRDTEVLPLAIQTQKKSVGTDETGALASQLFVPIALLLSK